MTPEFAVQIFRDALLTAFWLAAPLLAVAFLAGIVISLIQILTSIQDAAFSTVPRLAVCGVAAVLLAPWMLKKISAYMVAILGDLGRYAR